jgi:dihydroorotate dehydrogenase (NAD+) catalytic subunit
MKQNISTKIAGLKLKNPVMLAAGILGISGQTLRRVAESGAGAVVTKSTSLKPREGFPNPTIVEVPCGLLNAMGLPNPGILEMKREIAEAGKAGVPVVASVYGFKAADYSKAAVIAQEAGADAVELNVSCPHVKEVGAQIGQNPRILAEVTRAVKLKVTKPLIVKLSPNVSDITKMAEAAEKAGADAVTAINSVRAMAIDIDVQRPILSAKIGGLSGPAIKPIAVRCVYEIYEAVDIPVIGCGGVNSWQDAVEFILAGASAVQVGAAILRGDLNIFKEINEGIKKYMKVKGCKDVRELIGLSHKN